MTDESIPISETALESFRRELPRLIDLVDETFAVEARVSGDSSIRETFGFLKDVNRHFGQTILAVYELGLWRSLEAEFDRLASVLERRGLRPADLEKLLNAWASVIHGIVEPGSAGELAPPILALHRILADRPGPVPETIPSADPDRELFLSLMFRKKRREAAKLCLQLLRTRFSRRFEDAWVGLIAPCLREIDRRGQWNIINAADERAAIGIARYVVFRLSDSLQKSPPFPACAMIALVEGEEHAMASEALAEFLGLKGWVVLFPGRSAPLADTVGLAAKNKPDVVFLSASLVRNLPAARDALAALRKALPSGVLILGGRAAEAARPIFGKWADAVVGDLVEACAASMSSPRT